MACAALVASCHPENLSLLNEQGWAPEVKESLNLLLSKEGGGNAYAVFDFDKTSAVGDISQALWVYQIEHLRFADAPAHAFLDGITEPEKPLDGIGLTSAQMGAELQREYNEMKALLDAGESLDNIHKSDTYLDFRARMYSFLAGLDATFPATVSYIWMPGLLTGYTNEEANQVVKDAIKDQYGKDKPGFDDWISPDGRWGGPVEHGIWFSDEMKELYKCLKERGIKAYVCSASHELIVEALACDPVLGPGLPADQVFGLRTIEEDRFNATYDPNYEQPMKEGKVRCIKANMAPSHGGAGPVLVGGDSNGDVAMLTSFEDTRIGLIIDVNRPADSAIGQLISRSRAGDSRFIVQPNFIAVPTPPGGGI